MKKPFLNEREREQNISIPTYLLLGTRDHWLWHGCAEGWKPEDAVGDRWERKRRLLDRGNGGRDCLSGFRKGYHPHRLCLEEESGQQDSGATWSQTYSKVLKDLMPCQSPHPPPHTLLKSRDAWFWSYTLSKKIIIWRLTLLLLQILLEF